jgi:hypothetical protein
MPLSYVGAGAFVESAGVVAGNVLVPAVPLTQAGDLVVLFFTIRRMADPAITGPAGYTLILNQANATGSSRIWTAYKILAGADVDETVSWTNGLIGGTVIAQKAAWRPSTGENIRFGGQAALTGRDPAKDIGPQPAPINLSGTDLLIFQGHHQQAWTSVDTLAGDSQVWAEIGEKSSALGNIASAVWDYSLLGALPSITDKTFVCNGATAGPANAVNTSFSFFFTTLVAGAGRNLARLGVGS